MKLILIYNSPSNKYKISFPEIHINVITPNVIVIIVELLKLENVSILYHYYRSYIIRMVLRININIIIIK
jgi:hypothetical protein